MLWWGGNWEPSIPLWGCRTGGQRWDRECWGEGAMENLCSSSGWWNGGDKEGLGGKPQSCSGVVELGGMKSR